MGNRTISTEVRAGENKYAKILLYSLEGAVKRWIDAKIMRCLGKL